MQQEQLIQDEHLLMRQERLRNQTEHPRSVGASPKFMGMEAINTRKGGIVMGAEKKFIASALNNEDRSQLKKEVEQELEKY